MKKLRSESKHDAMLDGKYCNVVAAVVGSAVVGGAISADSSRHAANQQKDAANQANATQQQFYNQTRDDQAPFRQAGNNALGAIQGGFGLGPASGGVTEGQFNHSFNGNDLKNGLSPNYDFMLQQGLGAVNNQNSVTGGLVGGNALKGISDYAQSSASSAYQKAFDNYNTNQTNIYNRLSNLAGLGQTSNGQTTQAGATYAGNIGSAQMAGGAAQAAGIMGGANAISGGLNNAAGSFYASQYMPNRSQIPQSAINQANMSADPIASLNGSQGWSE